MKKDNIIIKKKGLEGQGMSNAAIYIPNILKDCCIDCGKRQYQNDTDMRGNTMHKGKCPFCKKNTWLIPARDWDTNSEWD